MCTLCNWAVSHGNRMRPFHLMKRKEPIYLEYILKRQFHRNARVFYQICTALNIHVLHYRAFYYVIMMLVTEVAVCLHVVHTHIILWRATAALSRPTEGVTSITRNFPNLRKSWAVLNPKSLLLLSKTELWLPWIQLRGGERHGTLWRSSSAETRYVEYMVR